MGIAENYVIAHLRVYKLHNKNSLWGEDDIVKEIMSVVSVRSNQLSKVIDSNL